MELRAGVLLLDQKTDAAKKLYDEAVLAEKSSATMSRLSTSARLPETGG